MLAGFEAPLFPAYRDLVATLADRLETIDPARLALEPVNEPSHACGAAEWDLMQDSLLAAARREAPTLTLVATGSCGSMVSGLEPLMALPLERFRPPPLHLPFLRALPVQPPGRALDERTGLSRAQQRALARLGRKPGGDARLRAGPDGGGSRTQRSREARRLRRDRGAC